MAARHERGIALSQLGTNNTLPNSSTPCPIVESFVLLPALTFTELRTIAELIGSPPISPQHRLPIPCTQSSRLGGELRCCGSILSTASRFKSVSSEATAAIVKPAV